jgi:hypothetical protein
MLLKTLMMGGALALLAGGASAATRHHHATRALHGGNFAAPDQPIPYDQLSAYIDGRAQHAQPGSDANPATSDTPSSTSGAPRSTTPDTGTPDTGTPGAATPGTGMQDPPK